MERGLSVSKGRKSWHSVLSHKKENLDCRHATRLVLDPDSMWSLMLKAKYGLGSTVRSFEAS